MVIVICFVFSATNFERQAFTVIQDDEMESKRSISRAEVATSLADILSIKYNFAHV